jgi:DNA helicase II / ATP-dependent DNA helicase PcrA
MITISAFHRTCQDALKRKANPEQAKAIDTHASHPLFIVAGPGTGKTACLALRILKLIFVDAVPPTGILATTFTKKAAAELRSRILGWGFCLIENLFKDKSLPVATRKIIESTDINQVLTGTIDSICEQLLRDYRDPGTQPPILVDDFVSRTLMLRGGLFSGALYKDEELDQFLFEISARMSKWGWNIGAKNDILMTLWDRRIQDQVDWDLFLKSDPKEQKNAKLKIDLALNNYATELKERLMVDFASLESEVLQRLRQNLLQEFQEQLQVVLVDEYQDTNLLQESIYFELAKSCNGALTVVGDDDQSLYRFRGATVELFSNFSQRYQSVFKKKPKSIFLKTNYRSTRTIIDLVNNYSQLDSKYQQVRVRNKPGLVSGPSVARGVSILGMFRDDKPALARDLATFIHQVFRRKGARLPDGSKIQCNTKDGNVGDCCLLCSSPQEQSGVNERLPLLMRRELSSRGVETFNPRGQPLSSIEDIRIFGGLLLECLDPGGIVEGDTSGINNDISNSFRSWRDEAIAFCESNAASQGLLPFAQGWAERQPRKKGWAWPKSVPILELVYGLTHFFPNLHDNPEGQIYLEVFTRQVSACEQVGKFSSRVVTDPTNPGLSEASVKELLRNFLVPVATGAVGVNEDLVGSFPRDRFSILSIHQAKGLEFPLTIVDVGSDFKNNHPAHAFKRFPVAGGAPHSMEDILRKGHPGFSTLTRSAVDRAFDDLFRQFFVAFSRAQDVLLLVGLTPSLPTGGVRNIATGWSRDGHCAWRDNLPFVTI